MISTSKLALFVGLVATLLVLTNANPLLKEDWTTVRVRNSGGYVARFEVRYALNGKYVSEESGKYPVGQARALLVPPEATSVIIKCENDIFVNSWSTIFVVNLPRAQTKCYDVSGTTLNPKWGEVNC